jgi:hypothetical protein
LLCRYLARVIHEQLDLSYKNSRELNKIIDKQLPSHPKFRCEQIVIAGEAFDIFYRDVIECVKALYGDPDFANFSVFALEHHYADKEQTVWLYYDMHTGKWWWDTQVSLYFEDFCSLKLTDVLDRKNLISTNRVQLSF